MKKFIVTLLVALCGAVSLFAGDAEDIKALLIKDLELGASGDFMEELALRTPDYVEISPTGTINYEQAKWMFLALDGEHPEEFFLASLALGSHGEFKAPTAEMMARIRAVTSNPDFLREYKEVAAKTLAAVKADQELQLKTLEIVSVEVGGDSATARIELDSNNKHHVGTISLRKIGGKWMFCKSVFEYK